jgi:glycosyltransferase involved in cell wall biosynthesis
MRRTQATRRPTVLHLADYGGPYPGNFIASLRALAPELARRGMDEVLAFSPVAGGRKWLADLRAEGFDARLLPASRSEARRQITRAARAENVAIIHTHFTTYDVAAWVVQQSCRLLGRAPEVVWHVHSPTEFQPGRVRDLKDMVKWRLMGSSAHAVVVSDGGYQVMVERGMRTDRGRAVSNGIDTRRLEVATEERARTRRTLGVADGERLCLLFGWAPERKGVDLAIAAARGLVEDDRLPVKLVLVGDAPTRAAADRACPAGLPPWLQVAPPLDSVGAYLAASDLFVSASRAEGFSYAVTEALAFGRPVATTDIPGMEWARSMPAAVFCTPDDAGDLRRSMRLALSWPAEVCAARFTASRELIQGRYTVEAWARQIVDYYREILDLSAAGTVR